MHRLTNGIWSRLVQTDQSGCQYLDSSMLRTLQNSTGRPKVNGKNTLVVLLYIDYSRSCRLFPSTWEICTFEFANPEQFLLEESWEPPALIRASVPPKVAQPTVINQRRISTEVPVNFMPFVKFPLPSFRNRDKCNILTELRESDWA